ncbi:FAD-binding oxidoreductase [Paratractidigestivibacter sp.]|uniref:FAD-binding oxidoreductase n=1 Tax=Paratractidigestivibacter sp. TaxID=2847316 RepID=UPI002AC9327B|nr:FAD-binding oxidoreductase [Paratractidigestivibacter sp.]
MAHIRPFTDEYEEYRRDESRSSGEAETISFPTSEDEVRDVLRELYAAGTPVTVQGARTGLAAGAVPHGGHVLNVSRMTRYLGMRQGEDGTFYLAMEPGVVLSELRKHLAGRNIAHAGWDEASLAALEAFEAAPEQFFPTDPTEASACMGGIVACNASGARSYKYGPVRPHVMGLHVALSDGDLLVLMRGERHAEGRTLRLVTESGRELALDLPTYAMPATKNASGYFVADGMDAIDLFIGACGTLGVITQIEVALMPAPAVVWGVSCFFASEEASLDFTEKVRPALSHAAAIEFFDEGALNILRRQREASTAFSALPQLADDAVVCVYVELDCASEDQATSELYRLGEVLEATGGSESATWVARTEVDRESLIFFRHAVPESVNMLIDERRRTDPTITKLGSDMSVPDEHLHDVFSLYRRTLAEAGLESAAWGHIGNNHIHVNVLPRDAADHRAGGELFAGWAAEVSRMGGAVSAEHGVGKIKAGFLATMYGPEHIAESALLKAELDPKGQLGRGNLFGEDVLEAALAKVAGGADAPAPAAGEKGGE